MALTRKCINPGGGRSRIQLPEVPSLDTPLEVGPAAVDALNCWRARVGEIVTVNDPRGTHYRARVIALGTQQATLQPFVQVGVSESPLRIELFQAIPEKERFELILQKATELGVARVTPFVSARSITVEERDAGQKKSHRWPDVLLRAARQCRRAELPELAAAVNWQQALEQSAKADLALICYEGQQVAPLAQCLREQPPRTVAVMVGPEGGFQPAEIEQARELGLLPVGLGPRILRTETAAIIAIGALQFALGDLGN